MTALPARRAGSTAWMAIKLEGGLNAVKPGEGGGVCTRDNSMLLQVSCVPVQGGRGRMGYQR